MEKVIKLNFINGLEDKLKKNLGLIQVVLGPRQVGKTTGVLDLLENNYDRKFLYLSADGVFNSTSSWLEEQWIEARQNYDLLVVDEIQKVENWSEIVKKLWDEDRRNKENLGCILLGSSSLDIQQGLSESLTGRVQITRAYHWNYYESKALSQMSLEEYLKYGGYPGSYAFKDNKKEFVDYIKQSIISTVIEKDIFNNHKVKSPSLFKQAFELIMSYPAQEISYTKLLGQLQDKGNVEVVKYYISLFEGAFLVKSLHKYSGKKLKQKISSPKILPLCPVLYYAEIQDDYEKDERGRVFELVVGSSLVRHYDDIYYWREGNFEVDYVVKVGRKLLAIEVKSGRRKSPKGLDKFVERFPEAKKVFITPENYEEFERKGREFLEASY